MRQAKFVADDILIFLSMKQVDISCESSAKQKQTIHMTCQDLFSLKKKKK